MAHGPPPSAAESSHSNSTSSKIVEAKGYMYNNFSLPLRDQTTGTSSTSDNLTPRSSALDPRELPTAQYTTPAPRYYSAGANNVSQPYPQPTPPQASVHYPHVQNTNPNFAYYNYPPNTWPTAWSYPYGMTGNQQYGHLPEAIHAQSTKPEETTPSPSRSPSPHPELFREWDVIIKAFLSSVGLTQALRGFETDLIVMNSEWEKKKVPSALDVLLNNLLKLRNDREGDVNAGIYVERPLNERKLDYVHLAEGVEPRLPASINKSISRFLAENRGRNDVSNRDEFLLSLAEKRRRLNEDGDALPSCARTDAKPQNRDLQMKYDIAKNEDGPLRRTLKAERLTSDGSAPMNGGEDYARSLSSDGHSFLDDRLRNVETHLAVKYVPSSPRSIIDRLKFLEDHIIHLEKEYPPWAALHFNQPSRGWPLPPRPTPIIVPSHLTSTNAPEQPQDPLSSSLMQGSTTSTISTTMQMPESTSKSRARPGRPNKSSLHRAVLEKLEVQKAMHDLAGEGG